MCLIIGQCVGLLKPTKTMIFIKSCGTNVHTLIVRCVKKYFLCAESTVNQLSLEDLFSLNVTMCEHIKDT